MAAVGPKYLERPPSESTKVPSLCSTGTTDRLYVREALAESGERSSEEAIGADLPIWLGEKEDASSRTDW
jgi:hypothetical protein